MPTLGAMSNFLEEAILNGTLRNITYSAPDNVYLALYTNNPTDSDTGTEVSGGDYERQPVSFTSPTQTEGRATVENENEIEFEIATEDWGTITHMGIRDSQNGGNLLYYGELQNSKTIDQGDQFRVQAGDLVIDLD